MSRNIYDLKRLFQVKSCSEITIEVTDLNVLGTSAKHNTVLTLEESKNLIREKSKISNQDKKYIKKALQDEFNTIVASHEKTT
jgi:hypothetical protein